MFWEQMNNWCKFSNPDLWFEHFVRLDLHFMLQRIEIELTVC